MKALTLTGIGGLEHLAMLEVPPTALRADDDVLIRVRCAALNRIDLWMTGGLPNVEPAFPHVVGSDGAGEVEAVGPGVRDWRPGDRVLINPGISCGHCAACEAEEESLCSSFGILGEHLPGTAAELVVVPAANLGRVPDGMSWSEAAAFPLATLTVWHMRTARAMLHAGETVLIWGVGLGRAAVLPHPSAPAHRAVLLASVPVAGLHGCRRADGCTHAHGMATTADGRGRLD